MSCENQAVFDHSLGQGRQQVPLAKRDFKPVDRKALAASQGAAKPVWVKQELTQRPLVVAI